MKLPSVETPIYKTNLIVDNKTIEFRPFLVKEEKILLMAMQTEDHTAIIKNLKEILKNCILTNINIEELTSFDCINLFIELRKKSIGEIINISVLDFEKNKSFDAEMDLNDIKIVKVDNPNNIKLDENIGIILKYPSIDDYYEFIKNNDKLTSEIFINFIVKVIDKIYDKEKVYNSKDFSTEDIIKFIENLTSEMFEKITKFINNIPKIVYNKKFKSPYSKKEIEVVVENFIDFLT